MGTPESQGEPLEADESAGGDESARPSTPQWNGWLGDVFAALGNRIRGQVADKSSQQRYPKSREVERQERVKRRKSRRKRRRQFWRDVAVQFIGSIAAAYFVILAAVLLGYLEDPLIIAGIGMVGVGLAFLFFVVLAYLCVVGIFVQIEQARHLVAHSGDDRFERQGLAVRVLALAVLALICIALGLGASSLVAGWMDPLLAPLIG